MEILLDESKYPNLHETLLISKERAEQLYEVVQKHYLQIAHSYLKQTKLTLIYKQIASECINMNEYTLCMHVLIFNLSKIGVPADDPLVSN